MGWAERMHGGGCAWGHDEKGEAEASKQRSVVTPLLEPKPHPSPEISIIPKDCCWVGGAGSPWLLEVVLDDLASGLFLDMGSGDGGVKLWEISKSSPSPPT